MSLTLRITNPIIKPHVTAHRALSCSLSRKSRYSVGAAAESIEFSSSENSSENSTARLPNSSSSELSSTNTSNGGGLTQLLRRKEAYLIDFIININFHLTLVCQMSYGNHQNKSNKYSLFSRSRRFEIYLNS